MSHIWIVIITFALLFNSADSSSAIFGHLVFQDENFESNVQLLPRNHEANLKIETVQPEGHFYDYNGLFVHGVDRAVEKLTIHVTDQNGNEMVYQIKTEELESSSIFRVVDTTFDEIDNKIMKLSIDGTKYLPDHYFYKMNLIGDSSERLVTNGDEFVLTDLNMGSEYTVYITARSNHPHFNKRIYKTAEYKFVTVLPKIENLKVWIINISSALVTWDNYPGLDYLLTVETMFTKNTVEVVVVENEGSYTTNALKEGNMYTFYLQAIGQDINGDVADTSCRTDGYGIQHVHWNGEGGMVYIMRPRTDIQKINWPFAMKLTMCDEAVIRDETTNCAIEDYDFKDEGNSYLITQRKNWMYHTKYLAIKYKAPGNCSVMFEEFVLPILVTRWTKILLSNNASNAFYVADQWSQGERNILRIKANLSKYFYLQGSGNENVKKLTYKPDYVRILLMGSADCKSFKFEKSMTRHIFQLRKSIVKGSTQLVLKQKEKDFYVNDLTIFLNYNATMCNDPSKIAIRLLWKTLEYKEPTKNRKGVTTRVFRAE